MFVIFLKFSDNKSKAPELMDDHNAWLQRGFEEGVFLVAGSLQPNLGGGLLAQNSSLSELQDRVNSDPFVINNVVSAEIYEISPVKTDERLSFLLN